MKTIHGLDYSLKIKNIIIKSINEAKQNPFINYYFIVDDPLYFEEVFFKYTDTLFNIQLITYNDFIKKLLKEYKLYQHQELTKLDKILITKQLIEQDNNNIFNNKNKINLINELIDIFDLFYLEELENIEVDHLPPLAKQKINTIFNLYKQLLNSLSHDKCYKYEEILIKYHEDTKTNNHYIFITESIFNNRRYNLIKKLSLNNQVTVLINDNNDSRNLNKPFIKYHSADEISINSDNSYLNHLNKYIFSMQSPKYDNISPLYTIIQTTPKAQIESVVLNIYQDIVNYNNHYHDYAIYYPNEEYLELLVETLNNFNIPHNIKNTLVFKELDACLLWLKYCLTQRDEYLLNLLDTKTLNKYNDYNQLDIIKKNYLENGYLDDPYSLHYHFNNAKTLSDFSTVILEFIKNEFYSSPNQAILINFFSTLTSTQSFTLDEFYNLINILKPSLKDNNKPCNDHLYLLNYNQCYSGILECKQVYLVGVNETIVPTEIKDTGILLDQDYQTLKLPDLNYQIALQQNNILKILNSQTKFLAICFSHATIDGQPLLESSLYNQLKEMFTMRNIKINNDYLHSSLKSNLYLHGGVDINQTKLNAMIDKYIESKNQPNCLTIPIFSNHLSASKLETYNGCPYKYLNQYGLKLYPFKQPIFQINEIGTMVHYVLEKTRPLFEDNITAYSANIDDLSSIIEQYINQYIEEQNLSQRISFGINEFIIKIIKHDLINTIIILINQMKSGDFSILDTEMKISQNFPDFKLSGIVDRVDRYNDYLKVIDYKSSNKDFDISLAIQGFNIQMLLYLDALTKKFDVKKGALLYFNTKKRVLPSKTKITEEDDANNFFKLYKMNGYVNEEIINEIDNNIEKESSIIKAKYVKKDDCFKGNILTDFSFERLVTYVHQHINNLYQELASGNIGIKPKGSDDTSMHTKVNPCAYCNYRSLCNFDVFYNEYSLVDTNNLEHLIMEEDSKNAN